MEFMAEHRQEDVAVVVPVYNEEKTVAGVIESLLDRGYRVIAVDDGSRDSTPEILAGIASEREGLSVYTHVIN
ncbi:MAG: glycosyltransferase, partial [Methanothermobacter sp.]|nr:glycosyltransferase [Methanothermobacter sp.]